MQANRRARIQSVLEREISLLINDEVKDPRITHFLHVTKVELNHDASKADIFISLASGTPQADAPEEEYQEFRETMKNIIHALRDASGFVRRSVASVMTTRSVPELHFKEDKGLENSIRVEAILEKIKKESHS